MKRAGSDLTILTIGPSLYPAMKAAEQMARTSGLSAEVIDARSLVPFDYDLLLDSVLSALPEPKAPGQGRGRRRVTTAALSGTPVAATPEQPRED